jgi:hypothetical protein
MSLLCSCLSLVDYLLVPMISQDESQSLGATRKVGVIVTCNYCYLYNGKNRHFFVMTFNVQH